MPGKNPVLSVVLFFLLVAVAYLPGFLPVRDSIAIESLQLSLVDLVGDDLQLEGLNSRLVFSRDNHLQLDITADKARFAAFRSELTDISLHCVDFQPAPVLSCRNGTFRVTTPSQQRLTIPVGFSYQAASGRFTLTLGKLESYWRSLSLQWLVGTGSQLNVNGQAVNLSLYTLARDYFDLPEIVLTSGQLDMEMQLSLAEDELARIVLDGKLSDVTLSNQETTQAMEAVSGTVSLAAHYTKEQWQGELDLKLASGYLYSDPLGIDATTSPLQFTTHFAWHQSGAVELTGAHWQQPGVADLTADASFKLKEQFQLSRLQVDAKVLNLATIYPAYIQPWLYEYDIPELQFAGKLSGEFNWSADAISLDLSLQDAAVQEAEALFGITGINGTLDWSNQGDSRDSSLSWQAANFYDLPFGASRLAFRSDQDSLVLTEPLAIPFFDGAIQIDAGSLQNLGTDNVSWSFNAYVKPVSMLQITKALGWQTFGGKLAGMVPELRYQDRQLQVDGTLLVNAFDGNITVNHLQIDEPFGLVPRLQADIDINNLDLEAVTGTFSFGKIEGRMDGYIHNLEMLAWQPVKFDALLITPDDDDSRHRISQRAVDNLTRIGGGVGGALSRSFLRFFEAFPYDKLGIGCRLEQGVCLMRGAQPAEQGYYIVKGGFLPPRIDIVGYADRVDWSQLVNQLIEVTKSGDVTVE